MNIRLYYGIFIHIKFFKIFQCIKYIYIFLNIEINFFFLKLITNNENSLQLIIKYN